jgi:antitoxin PrlF
MIQSRITSKAQTTIPAPVCRALGLRAGDRVAYRIEEGRVILTRVAPADGPGPEDPFASFTEWDGAADRTAYDGF